MRFNASAARTAALSFAFVLMMLAGAAVSAFVFAAPFSRLITQ